MKNIIFPNNVFKVSDKNNQIYISNKYKKELFSFFSLQTLIEQENINFIINLFSSNQKQLKINLSDQFINKFLSFCKCNIIFNVENNNLLLQNSKQINLTNIIYPVNIEFKVNNAFKTKLSKHSITKSLNAVKNITLYNVDTIPINFCDPMKMNIIKIHNHVPENPVVVWHQIAPNLILDLSELKNIDFMLPFFNISFDGNYFFKGINFLGILDNILLGPLLLLNKNVSFVSSCIENQKNIYQCNYNNKKLKIRNPIIMGVKSLILLKKLSKILKIKLHPTQPVPYKLIWLAFAKHQKEIKNDYYYHQPINEPKHYRGEILDMLIEIVEESIKNPKTNYHDLNSFKTFESFIFQISKNKNKS